MKISPLILLLICSTTLYAAPAIKLACIGNSITEGNIDGKYVPKLQALLGSGYTVENDGVSGTTMLKKGDKPYWTKGQLGRVFAFKPDIVTIKLGTNDTKPQNWDTHNGEFKNDYLAMIDTLNKLTKKPEIVLVLPVPVFTNTYNIRDSALKKIIIITKEIADERKLTLIDANTPFLNHRNYFPDGVHPNDAGADTLAKLIARYLTMTTGSVSGPTGRPSINSQLPGRRILPFSHCRLIPDAAIDASGRSLKYRESPVNRKRPGVVMYRKGK